MSFTFGSGSCRVGTVEKMTALVGGTAHLERQQFLQQWHMPRALCIDFEKLGMDPNELTMSLDDCDVKYEYADAGHITFLTKYHSNEALQKDMELIKVADQNGCVKWIGLEVAITMDARTGAAFRGALLKARRK